MTAIQVPRNLDLASLGRLLRPEQIVTNPVELITYEIDASSDRGRPDVVVFPHNAADVARIVRWARDHRVPVVARGAGTGLSGGAVAERGGLLISFSRMNRILEIDEAGRSAVVEPGVVNLELDNLVKSRGLYFPPDPSSGRSATIGGNIAENAGGPHCFKYGVTTNYITGLSVVLADGTELRLGGRALDYPEYDLTGLLNGSEGTLGLVTEATARLLRNTRSIQTMMAAFNTVEEAGEAVSALIARGLAPATMELMDQKMMGMIEDFAHAGLPTEAGAALIIEADGYPESTGRQIEEIAAIMREHQASSLRIAQTAEERDKIWYGRKSAAGAMTRLAPAYYLVDGTVPRSKLAETLSLINQVADQASLRVGHVFHAGDGNLHPFILIPDPKDPELMRRVMEVGREVMVLCVRQGGSITGEHGVGMEKRQYMALMYNAAELSVMTDLKAVFDPAGVLNPGKIFPADLPAVAAPQPPGPAPASPFKPASLAEAEDAIRAWQATGQTIRICGGGTKSGLLPAAELTLSTGALRGILACCPQDLYVTAAAGTTVSELQAALRPDGMTVPLVSPWPASTVGGIAATGFNAPLRMRYGAIRDLVLATTAVLPDGRVIRAGRPVVKNVAGYDLPKLLVGSHGTLGLLADVTFKLVPLPRARTSLSLTLDSLALALDYGARWLQISLVASAVLLCGNLAGTVADPYTLVFTAEGMPEDVDAELLEARQALRLAGAPAQLQETPTSGSALWGDWLQSALPAGGERPAAAVLRAGVPAKDMAGFMLSLLPVLGSVPFITDLANGLLYVQTNEIESVRRLAKAVGGYAVVLVGAGISSPASWGDPPPSLPLMRAIKARWDPHGTFNAGAFLA